MEGSSSNTMSGASGRSKDDDIIQMLREDLSEVHARSPRPSLEEARRVVALNFTNREEEME